MNTEPKLRKLFLVTGSRRSLHIWANDSGQAKRFFCREFGISPNDYFCGVGSLSARALKPDEVEAWKMAAPALAATGAFIKGMMDIYAKAACAASLEQCP